LLCFSSPKICSGGRERQTEQKPAAAAAAMRIEDVQSTSKKQRVATHTHIKGLGLDVPPLSTPPICPALSAPPARGRLLLGF
jgi:hypothetical protein